MNDIFSEIGLLKRQVRDVQSVAGNIQHMVRRQADERARGGPLHRKRGQQLVQLAASRFARLIGNVRAADQLEQKAATAPAMTTVATWAAELSAAGLPGFIMSIQRSSALAGILARSPHVSLLGANTFSVPVAGLAPGATIVPEGNAIPIQKGSFAALVITPFKLAAIMHYSEELQNASSIEAVTRALLEQSISAGLDLVAFGSDVPGGLLAGVTPITASTATPLETAMRQDFQNLLAALTAPSTDTTFVMSPGRAAFASSVLPPSFIYGIAASTALPAATVVAVDPQGIAAALTNEPRIAASRSATVHENDSALPLSVVGTIAAPQRSAFQTDVVLLRVVADVAWSARTGAVASITAVTW